MKNKYIASLILISSLLMTDCSSYDGLTKKQFRSARLRQRRTTRSYVIQKWGEPYQTTINAYGRRTITVDTYPSQTDSYRWVRWLPFVGYFYLFKDINNSVQENFTVTITYVNDILSNYSYRQTKN